jgi:hypothetical protein
MNSVQNICICKDRPTYDSQGNSRGNLQASQKGDYLDWVHSGQMVFEIVRWRIWAAWAVAKSNSRGPSSLSPLRSDGSRDGQAGRLYCMNGGQKTLKAKLNLKGDYQARAHSGQMVVVVIRQGSWTTWTVAKDAQMRVSKQLKSAKGPTSKQAECQPKKY